jgi:hypothetical protein
LLVAAAAVLVSAPSAHSDSVTISGIHWTGTGGGSTDPYWKVVAYPGVYPTPNPLNNPTPGTPISPYAAFIPSGGSPPDNVPNPWVGGKNNVGPQGSRWIALQSNDTKSLLTVPNADSAFYQDYTTIYRTSFTSSGNGSTFISLLTAADNAVSFFVTANDPTAGVDANVNYSNVWRPTVNGEQLGSERQGLGSLGWVEGTVNVSTGTNYLYAVVRDLLKIEQPSGAANYGYTGVIVVPEPSSIVLVGFGVAGIALTALRRRAKSQR